MPVNYMSAEYLDVFNELGNIGAGNATTALSQMLGRPIDMAVPRAKIVTFSEIADILGGPETVVVSGLVEISADLNGFILMIQKTGDAVQIVRSLTGSDDVPESPLDFDEMQQSALAEITNILVGAYVTAISSMTGLVVNLSIPRLAVDMAGAIMSVPAIEYGKVGDTVLFIETHFDDKQSGDEHNSIAGHFFMVPDVESCKRMLSSLGLDVG